MRLSVRLPVCLSQVGIVSKRLDRSSWFLVWMIRSTYPTLYFKEIRLSPKLRHLELYPTLLLWTLENFATVSRSSCQQNSSTVELVDHTYDGRCVVAWVTLVHYTSVDSNTITPLLPICCRFVAQLVHTVAVAAIQVVQVVRCTRAHQRGPDSNFFQKINFFCFSLCQVTVATAERSFSKF